MTIRLLQKIDWPVIAEFNKIQYKPDHILTNKTYYDWQFDNVFNSNKDNYTSLGLFDYKENLVGTIGLFPAPCNFFGRSVKCNWIANLIVKENLRSLGYGAMLLKAAEKGFDLAVDHNVNDLARPLFEKMGYQVNDIKRYLCVLNPMAVEVLAGEKNLDFKVFEGRRTTDPDTLEFKTVAHCGSEFDLFWEKVKSIYPISIDRSSRYLNWRFSDNPLVRYHMFSTQKGNHTESLAVLRIEDITEGEECRPSGMKIGRLVDFVSTLSAEEYTLSKLMEFCRKQKLALVDFFGTGAYGQESLERVGFVGSDTHPYSLIPTLLNPIDRVKRTKHNFAFKIINENHKNHKVKDLDNWYTTKSCGDQDRPY